MNIVTRKLDVIISVYQREYVSEQSRNPTRGVVLQFDGSGGKGFTTSRHVTECCTGGEEVSYT